MLSINIDIDENNPVSIVDVPCKRTAGIALHNVCDLTLDSPSYQELSGSGLSKQHSDDKCARSRT